MSFRPKLSSGMRMTDRAKGAEFEKSLRSKFVVTRPFVPKGVSTVPSKLKRTSAKSVLSFAEGCAAPVTINLPCHPES
jgi:hypothetical protein